MKNALRIVIAVILAPFWIPGIIMVGAMGLLYFIPGFLMSVGDFAVSGEWTSPLDWGR